MAGWHRRDWCHDDVGSPSTAGYHTSTRTRRRKRRTRCDDDLYPVMRAKID